MEIMTNEDEGNCPDECFRPVGLEWSAGGEMLFMAADASGEVYVVYRGDGSPVNEFTVATRESGEAEQSADTTTEGGAQESASPSAGSGGDQSGAPVLAGQWWMLAGVAAVGAFFL
jgi:hypothetical protein